MSFLPPQPTPESTCEHCLLSQVTHVSCLPQIAQPSDALSCKSLRATFGSETRLPKPSQEVELVPKVRSNCIK